MTTHPGMCDEEALSGTRVHLRIRPPLEAHGCLSITGPDTVGISAQGYSKPPCNVTHYSFDGVHGPESSQEALFRSVAQAVDAAWNGYKTGLLAYGQTGSGKTHTLLGSLTSDRCESWDPPSSSASPLPILTAWKHRGGCLGWTYMQDGMGDMVSTGDDTCSSAAGGPVRRGGLFARGFEICWPQRKIIFRCWSGVTVLHAQMSCHWVSCH